MKDVNILINNGANIKKALELFGDMETYDATLETFLQEVPGKLKKIKACKEIGDMANYAILVHSLKSDARYFGFETLGELAYDHELKSKANDMYYVSEHFNELMTEANRVVNLVKKYIVNYSTNASCCGKLNVKAITSSSTTGYNFKFVAIEKDSITARLAKYLTKDKAYVFATGFEK